MTWGIRSLSSSGSLRLGCPKLIAMKTEPSFVNGTAPKRKPTILVVDDEPEMLRSIHDLLRLDFQILPFERGSDALKTLALDDSISVILSDQRMPGLTGVELLRRAKEIRPEVTRLLFTGYADIRAVIDAINEGNVFRYLTKPWNLDEMQSIIRQAVEHHDLLVEKQRLLRNLSETNAKLLEAGRLKNAFLEVASHELNTPVAVVLGLTELWKFTQAAEADPVARSWVDKIHGAGKRLAATVERMFKLIRSDQPFLALELTEIDLRALIRRVIADLGPFLVARHQTVKVACTADIGCVTADRSKMADIITNLMTNAIKFTPDGGEIEIKADSLASGWVKVTITDGGTGVRPEDKDHLFEPFFTSYDTMHHSSGEYQYGKRGIGLGLCLVKTFVELHGGYVDHQSHTEGGSSFGFAIPRDSTVSRQTPEIQRAELPPSVLTN